MSDRQRRGLEYELGLFYPSIATLAGRPATAIPLGRTRAGLPIGVQVIGPYLRDRTPLRFAALLEREIGGFVPPPITSDRPDVDPLDKEADHGD